MPENENAAVDAQSNLTADDNSVAEQLAQPEEQQSSTPDAGGGESYESEPGKEVVPPFEPGAVAADEGEETADDWLPDAQQKEFPVEVLARYAERHGYTLEQLQADPKLQRLMGDLVNNDVSAREAAANAQRAETQRAPTPQEIQAQRQRYAQFVGNVVNRVFDPDAVNALGKDLYKAFGCDVDSMDEWDPAREDVIANAPKVGATLARSLVDGVYTALPHLLLSPDPNTGMPPLMGMAEAVMPGIGDLWEHATYATAWAKVAHANGLDHLEYGSPDFTKELEAVGRKMKGFDELIFKDKSGRPLPFNQQVTRKYQMLCDALIKSGRGRKSSSRPAPKKPGRPTGDSLADFIQEENFRGGF